MNNTSLLERCLDVIRSGGATYDIDECVKDLEAAIAEQKDPISHYAKGYTDAMHRAEQAKPQADETQDFDKLAKLGWQAIECSLCGSSAMAFPVAQAREPAPLGAAMLWHCPPPASYPTETPNPPLQK